MLTRDLLMHRTRKGRIRPTFLDISNASLLGLAKDLIEVLESSKGESRENLEAGLNARVSSTRKMKVAKGLVKLLLDRSEFEEPDGEAMERRFTIFETAVNVFRDQTNTQSMEEYRGQVAKSCGQNLEDIQESLYSDLASRRKLQDFKPIKPIDLLHRYNLAQVQGLLLYAQGLELSTASQDITVVRKVLRWLRFCRLVAEVRRDDMDWRMVVDGPGSILSMHKKYGLQLAQFMSVIPVLGTFKLEAEIQLPRKAKAHLELSHEAGLVSHHRGAAGYVPEEITKTAEAFEDARWSLDLAPEPRHFGPQEMCVPDFRFHDEQTGTSVSVELFHRWHKGPLLRRIEALRQFPDPYFVLGVDKALGSSSEIGAKIENNDQIFVFNAFTSLNKLKKALKRYE